MKNKIKILGILVLSVVIFSLADDVQKSKTINLNSLITFNNANAEDTGEVHGCYDTFVIGCLKYIAINCDECSPQDCEQFLDPNTCP